MAPCGYRIEGSIARAGLKTTIMVQYNSFQDIPQFPRSYYKVNCGWGYAETMIQSLASNGKVILDPPYQRGYVWTQDQKERYVEYILRGGVSGRDIYFNCPNWDRGLKSAITGGWEDSLELVDGKQRLNAVSGFIKNEVLAFGRYFQDYGGKMRDVSVDIIINVGCLHTPLEVVDWYLGMNNGGTAHTQKDLQVAIDYRNSLLK
jgi:Protein of unknown function DUF262